MTRLVSCFGLALVLSAATAILPAASQRAPGDQGSSNVKVLAHIPLGRMFTTGDVEIEQELSRPYAYVSRLTGLPHNAGFNIIDLTPGRTRVIYTWQIENPELHVGLGGSDGQYFKLRGRYYYVQAFQFAPSGPDPDLGAVIFDVTGLPDTSRIREVHRLKLSRDLAGGDPTMHAGGVHNVLPYKHSDGRVIMFAITQSAYAHVYDMSQMLAGVSNQGLIARVPNPDSAYSVRRFGRGYHDFYAGYDPAAHQDKLYAAGYSGFYIFDVTKPEIPKLLTTITGVAGLDHAHTVTPSPDGRFVVGESEEPMQPLRLFDLKPGLDGTVKTISRPIGAWTARWQGLPHNHELRWPYVFVSTYEDGFQVFNMMDPTNPYTVGYYDTYDGPNNRGYNTDQDPESGNTVFNGAWGIDVRNADGLIVLSDFTTGFWAFKLDGFDGWNGHQWGMPNISGAQDWDNGPDGAPAKVS